MTVLRMRLVPDPILRRKAKKVGKIPANMKKLASNMVETMYDENGVGLAANQIGSLQKIAVIQTPEMEEPLVLINPEIVKQEGEREVEEGCLSIPGYRGIVKHSVSVRVRALGLDNKVIRIDADELLAQALEHEINHLNGILYIDRLVPADNFWKIADRDDQEEDAEEGDDQLDDNEGAPADDAVSVQPAQDRADEAG